MRKGGRAFHAGMTLRRHVEVWEWRCGKKGLGQRLANQQQTSQNRKHEAPARPQGSRGCHPASCRDAEIGCGQQ